MVMGVELDSLLGEQHKEERNRELTGGCIVSDSFLYVFIISSFLPSRSFFESSTQKASVVPYDEQSGATLVLYTDPFDEKKVIELVAASGRREKPKLCHATEKANVLAALTDFGKGARTAAVSNVYVFFFGHGVGSGGAASMVLENDSPISDVNRHLFAHEICSTLVPEGVEESPAIFLAFMYCFSSGADCAFSLCNLKRTRADLPQLFFPRVIGSEVEMSGVPTGVITPKAVEVVCKELLAGLWQREGDPNNNGAINVTHRFYDNDHVKALAEEGELFGDFLDISYRDKGAHTTVTREATYDFFMKEFDEVMHFGKHLNCEYNQKDIENIKNVDKALLDSKPDAMLKQCSVTLAFVFDDDVPIADFHVTLMPDTEKREEFGGFHLAYASRSEIYEKKFEKFFTNNPAAKQRFLALKKAEAKTKEQNKVVYWHYTFVKDGNNYGYHFENKKVLDNSMSLELANGKYSSGVVLSAYVMKKLVRVLSGPKD